MRSALWLLIGFAFLGAAPADEAPLPPEAQAALVELQKNVTKLIDKTSAELQKVLERETRAGKLESALAVQHRISELKETARDEFATEHLPRLEGTYNILSGAWNNITTMAFDDKNVVHASDGSSGEWVLGTNGLLVITWSNGNTNRCRLKSGLMFLEGDKGGSFTMVRASETSAIAH